MSNIETVKSLIENKLAGSTVEVMDMTGTDDHLEVIVASDEFKDKMLFEQHKMVMDILKEALKEQVHAVKIKTMTMEKFNNRN